MLSPVVAEACASLVPLAWLAAGHALESKDTVTLFAPVRGLVVAALRDLRLPLWNPHEALGILLFAQRLHGALHPVSLVAAYVVPASRSRRHQRGPRRARRGGR